MKTDKVKTDKASEIWKPPWRERVFIPDAAKLSWNKLNKNICANCQNNDCLNCKATREGKYIAKENGSIGNQTPVCVCWCFGRKENPTATQKKRPESQEPTVNGKKKSDRKLDPETELEHYRNGTWEKDESAQST